MTMPEGHDHATSAESFFSVLFDWDFNTFITKRAIKIVYILFVVFIGLGALAFFIAALSRGGGQAIAALIFVPLGALLYIIMIRISLEIIAIIFKIGDDTGHIRTALEK